MTKQDKHKVLLMGGGMPLNEFILVRVVKPDAKQPTVDAGAWRKRFRPIIGSWHLEDIKPSLLPQFEALPLGAYRMGLHDGKSIPVYTDRGEYTTTLDMTV